MASPDQFMPPGAFNAGSLAAFAATTEDDFRGALSLQFTPPLAVLHNGFQNALELLEQIPGLGPLIALAAENLQLLINSIANALGHTGGEPYTAGDIFTFLGDIPGALISGITTIEQNIIDAIANAMGHAGTGHTAANILTYLEAIPATAIANVLGAADLGADIQAVVDKISNALGHAGTGHTLANLLSYLGAIPGSVISGITTVEQAALDAIANALGHAGTGHTTSDIQTYLGAIPGSVISGITTIEQNALDAIANALGHAGTGHTTSDIQTYLGSIPATAISNILGSANFGADVQAIVTNLTTVFGGATTTLAGLNTTLGNTFGSSFPKVFPFTFGTSSSNTPGKFASLAQFQQLIDGIIGDGSQGNTVVAAVGAFHSWLAAVKSEISQAILNGLASLDSLTGIASALQSISHNNITNILGGTSLGDDVQSTLNTVDTFLVNLFNGLTNSAAVSATTSDVTTATSTTLSTASSNAAVVANVQSQVGLVNYGAVGALAANENFRTYADAATLGSKFTYTSTSGIFGISLEKLGISGGTATLLSAAGTNSFGVYYNVAPTATDGQTISVVKADAGGSVNVFGRCNSAGTTLVTGQVAGPFARIIIEVAGVQTILVSAAAGACVAGGKYTLRCGSASGTRYYDFLLNDVSLVGGEINDAGAVSSVGSTFRYGGFAEGSGTVSSFTVADYAATLTAPSVPAAALVTTSESTTSTSYTNLTTTTDTVTVTIGSSGMAQVSIYGDISGASFWGYFSYDVSGANTSAAADNKAVRGTPNSGSIASWGGSYGATFLETGLTPGSTTYKLKYRAQNAGGSQSFSNRRISVIPL